MFIDHTVVYHSATGDELIGTGVNYYASCKLKSDMK